MPFSRKDALKIARKLGAEIKDGRKHPQVVVRYQNYVIGQFGIQRASQEKDHKWIPRQIHLSRQKTEELCRCTFGKDDYFELLRNKGILPSK